ncbi:MAG: hypothetical protein MUO54_14460 [Anaerolineales bacterium]|nr:hypothetical protein [Anaerolineales bacterium]
MKKLAPRVLFRNLLIEIVIYGILIFGYYMIVLRFMADWLMSIFQSNLTLYAVIGLILIVVQAALLDFVTSLILKYIKLDQFGIRRILDVFSDR